MMLPYPEQRHTGSALTPSRIEALALEAALDYAASDWPVFPLHNLDENGVCSCRDRAACESPGKHPRTKRGHLDATTDSDQIRAWWCRWPNANIGIPTGERSGILALDEDNPAALDKLEATHGKLPATRTHSTGSGGMHYLYRYPVGANIRNSASTLAPGLDVRGEGGYIVAPGSRTTHPYEVLEDLPLSDAPAWLLQTLTRPTRTRRDDTGSEASQVSPLRAEPGETIPEGLRNQTMFFEALKGKDRGLDHAANLEAVRRINETRCIEPLPDAEVEKITASAMRYQVRRRSRETPPEVLAIVEELERLWWATAWRRVGGKTERDVLRVLIALAKRYGTLIPVGVRVSVSVRTLALAAATHYTTVSKVLKRLRIRMVLRKDDGHRTGTDSGAVVLLDPRLTANTQRHRISGEAKMLESVSGLSRPTVAGLQTPCFRWRGHVGKGKAGVLYALESFGKLTDEDLAEILGWSRVRDLRRKYLEPLEALGLVEKSGDRYGLPDAEAYVVAIETVRSAPVDRKVRRPSAEGRTVAVIVDGASEHEREQADRQKYEEQRREREGGLRQYRSSRPEPSRARRARPLGDQDRIRPEERTPSGTLEDLERVSDPAPDLLEALSRALLRWPDHADDYPSWWASTLYFEDYLPTKPTTAAVEVALDILREEYAA